MENIVADLLAEHPNNPVKVTGYSSSSNKAWTKKYPPITKLLVHTVHRDKETVGVTYDGPFIGEQADDKLRLSEYAYRPNYRQWRMAMEEDAANWFHTEISNVVLAAWANFPLITQASHEKPLSDHNFTQTVDVAYSVSQGNQKMHSVVGEFKRNLINAEEWQRGVLSGPRISLSQELRAYAHIYACPQIFCFDGVSFVMLQFKADTAEKIRDPNCEVDCWVFHRGDLNGPPIRFAFYRLLAQGFRRCQGMQACDVALYGQVPRLRQFYNGRPLWKIDGKYHSQPWDHCRVIDPKFGAFYWAEVDGHTPVTNAQGLVLWDTAGFWVKED